jgi:hypothetical protein
MNRAKSVQIASQNGASLITTDVDGKQVMNVFTILSAVFATVASAAAAAAQTNINIDGDFVLRQIIIAAVNVTTGANLVFPFPGTLQIVDTASNVTLFDQPQQFAVIGGDSRLPFVLPVPRRFRAGGIITSNIVNGVSPNNVMFNIAYVGVKLLPL